MTPPTVYDPERVSKISRIMPQFTKVARVGDRVAMGLEGDPDFPSEWKTGSRPMATVTNVVKQNGNSSVELRLDNGSNKVINEYTIAPGEVWEPTDDTFASILKREQEAQQLNSRAEAPHVKEQTYRGDRHLQDMENEIKMLKAELDEEKRLVRSFQNTYIMTMKELANDVMQLDSSGQCANFCRTFSSEYDKMQARAEESMYRGSENDKMQAKAEESMYRGGAEGDYDDESFSEASDGEEVPQEMGLSDFF